MCDIEILKRWIDGGGMVCTRSCQFRVWLAPAGYTLYEKAEPGGSFKVVYTYKLWSDLEWVLANREMPLAYFWKREACYMAMPAALETNSWNVVALGARNKWKEAWIEEAYLTEEQAANTACQMNEDLIAWIKGEEC